MKKVLKITLAVLFATDVLLLIAAAGNVVAPGVVTAALALCPAALGCGFAAMDIK